MIQSLHMQEDLLCYIPVHQTVFSPIPSLPPSLPPLSSWQVNGTLHEFVAVKFLTLAGSTWIVFLFGYFGILQIACLVLALKSRKIAIKVINDSREIRTIVYITSFVALETLILHFAVGNFKNSNVSLFLGHILAATLVTLLLIFIPKVELPLAVNSFYH